MAWTPVDVSKLKAAIAPGAPKVKFADREGPRPRAVDPRCAIRSGCSKPIFPRLPAVGPRRPERRPTKAHEGPRRRPSQVRFVTSKGPQELMDGPVRSRIKGTEVYVKPPGCSQSGV